MKRIMIMGSSGAGKSTLAHELGTRLAIEVIHLDALFWQPGWVETPRPVWAELQREFVQRPTWVIDGNYSGTIDLRLEAADTIIFLDCSRWLCLWRVIKRRIMYHGRTRPDMAAGCPEKLDFILLKFIWRYPAQRRPGILAKLSSYAATKTCIHLRSTHDVASFLRGLEAPGHTYYGRL